MFLIGDGADRHAGFRPSSRTLYRGVQGADGGFRMERRGFEAKAFKTFMWTGSEEGLYSHLKSIEWCHGKHNVAGFSVTLANK